MMGTRYKNRNRTALRCYLKDGDLAAAESIKRLSGCSMSQLLHLGLLALTPLVVEMGKSRDLENSDLTNYKELERLVKAGTGAMLLLAGGWSDGNPE